MDPSFRWKGQLLCIINGHWSQKEIFRSCLGYFGFWSYCNLCEIQFVSVIYLFSPCSNINLHCHGRLLRFCSLGIFMYYMCTHTKRNKEKPFELLDNGNFFFILFFLNIHHSTRKKIFITVKDMEEIDAGAIRWELSRPNGKTTVLMMMIISGWTNE